MRALFAALFDSKRPARQDAAMQPVADFLAKVTPPITPALVVRRAAMDANLAAMQAACVARGVRLRPHGKMHKCSTLGRLQVETGAVGLCCQTVGEAEAFVAGGIDDVLVTAPVPAWGWPRLAALANAARVGAVIDSEAQATAASAAAQAAGVVLQAFVDVDPGMQRAGVAPAAAPALARMLTRLPGLTYAGI
jgi:3-hydroxy-D-aspartate aldolase